ncbi:MAG: alpha/beta fold hydrolase [Solirubrobacterales bacterium]|nr:alpha/beta fold hydrolase [Solirubrobacterales bacterium]
MSGGASGTSRQPGPNRLHWGSTGDGAVVLLITGLGLSGTRLYAASLHNCFGRLDRIRAPTLVVHGRHDRMIPVENAELMAKRIPRAELRILEHSGHLLSTEEPRVEKMAAFLAAPEPA